LRNRSEYIIMSRSRVVVQTFTEIGSSILGGQIGEVWDFFLLTNTQTKKFFHLAYRSQIWTELNMLMLKTRGFRRRCAFWGSRWRSITFWRPNFPKTHFLGARIGISSQFCKNLNPCIFKTMHRISIKFNRLMRPYDKTSWVVLYDDATIPRWRTAAILNFKKL